MISELVLVRHNGTFWRNLLPGADDYVRLINSSLGERFAVPIDIEDFPQRRAYVNNVSFALFESCMNGAFRIQTLQDVNAATAGIQALLNTEKERLSNMRYGKQLGLQLDDTEWRIARLMAERLFRLYGKKHDTRMRPSFLGCGVLFAAEGDVHYEETLVEVKAGSRSISVYDLRQLLVYAALNDRSKEYPIRSLEICNPRTGFRWHERLAVVAENIAGATSVEIYNEIIDYVSSEHRSL